MKHWVPRMASLKQVVAVLSITIVGCSSPAPDAPVETAWGAATVVEELSIGVESDPDGTFLGSVVVPELFRPFVFRGEQVWGSLTDDEGVERIVRLRVVPEGR